MTESVKKCQEIPRTFGDELASYLEAHLALAVHASQYLPKTHFENTFESVSRQGIFQARYRNNNPRSTGRNPLQQLYIPCQLLAIRVFGVQKGFRCQRIAHD
mmetsp:Transcript_26588/g.41266  ORF Transcript_26588/g.41266 Transcript_26588/m.41266 type:complete len:102 (-) Transcript_26588:1086-1391(-)